MVLKKIRNRISLRNREMRLNLTPGEKVRDTIIEAGLRSAQEAGYAAGNTTEKLIKIAEKIGESVDLGTQLGAGGESATSLGKITFKAGKDIARGDTVCTGLCVVSGACETIAIGCSTVKIIPFRGKIYVCAKIVSRGCMTYRNLCAGSDC